jgi:prepilin-type N-terminal cleavage/methylation domain-containing protein
MPYNSFVRCACEKLAAAETRHGMTLLELLMVLTIIAAIIVVAIPTLRPVKASNLAAFARERLNFIAQREQAYFLRNGKFDRFSVLAGNTGGGPYLDRRFATDDYRERGIIFIGPKGAEDKMLLEAQLPDGTRITLNEKGNFKVLPPGGGGDLIPNPENMVPQIPRVGGETSEPPKAPQQPVPPRRPPRDRGNPPELPLPGG